MVAGGLTRLAEELRTRRDREAENRYLLALEEEGAWERPGCCACATCQAKSSPGTIFCEPCRAPRWHQHCLLCGEWVADKGQWERGEAFLCPRC